MSYRFSLERFEQTYRELEPLYRQHYAEMQKRFKENGIEISPYNPRLDMYVKASLEGYLLNFVARTEEADAVGYSNVYLTNDMHNGDLIAREDTIYIAPEHRNGVGRKLVQFVLEDLGQRGVKRGYVAALTDLRVAKLWNRMGFKHVAHQMVYEF